MNNLAIANCTQGALAATSFIQNKLTLPFLRTNDFLKGVHILGTTNCDVYASPTASGIEFREGLPCGKVNPVENAYEGRVATLSHFHVSKKLCKKDVMCSDFQPAQFAQLYRDEVWQALLAVLEREFFKQLFSDTTTSKRGCDGTISSVTALSDNITGTTIGKIDKAGLTADTVYQYLAGIVSKFRAANIATTGITIFMPYEMELLLSGAMANKSCCQWYSDIMFNNNVSGYTIAGMPLTIVSLDKSVFPDGATGYKRIIAVANNRVGLVYNTYKIYSGYAYSSPQYIDQQAVSQFAQTINNEAILDFYLGDPAQDDIGVVLLMKALLDFVFIRLQEKSILLLDIKNDIVT